MPSLFGSSETRARRRALKTAEHWLDTARLVWNFRRDLLTAGEAADLGGCRAALEQEVAAGSRADPARLDAAIRALEPVLRRTGGAVYPRNALVENVDFLVAAAVVLLGIRTFFFQPMSIPTNSMWPTYSGLTAETFAPGAAAPGPAARLARWLAFGAVRREVDAPVDGEVSALVVVDVQGQPHLLPAAAVGRSWGVIPEKLAEFTFLVADQPAKVRVPEDFHDMDQVFSETFFGPGRSFHDQWNQDLADGRIRESSLMTGTDGRPFRIYQMPLGRRVRAGEPLVRFDILRGDMLMVDSFSFNFVRPRVGTAFVFETGRIPTLVAEGVPDQYYIKRLAGEPGDVLSIAPPILLRNGRPIEGAGAFEANASRRAPYAGYVNPDPGRGVYLLPGTSTTVPPHAYMGLGDNSGLSEDSRYWGFVPEKDVVGRPLFIYYPLTRRWGLPR